MLMLLFLQFHAAAEDAIAGATAATAVVKQDEQMQVLSSLTGVCVVALS
jgi:hypothetical protein